MGKRAAAGMVLALIVWGGASTAEADESLTSETSARSKTNSLNLSPIGALFGSYGVNYLRLFDQQHGLLVEGTFAHDTQDDVSAIAYGALVGYRWHWSGEQDSGFIGVNVAAANATAEAKAGGQKVDVSVTQVAILPNIGRRWAWDGGFNLTLRFGVGRAFRDFSTSSKVPEAKQAVEDVEEFFERMPVAFDGELSIGWIF